jgi:hypothetical protein
MISPPFEADMRVFIDLMQETCQVTETRRMLLLVFFVLKYRLIESTALPDLNRVIYMIKCLILAAFDGIDCHVVVFEMFKL